MSALAPYPLDNDDKHAHLHHRLLAEMLDAITRRRLTAAVTRARSGGLVGARCLEVGAGGGSIARWLCGAVGPRGHVTALDLKPHHIHQESGLTVVQHDLTGDEPLPAGPFDVIHARLVLSHLPQRRTILARLVDRLHRNGTLLIGDWRTTNPDPVVAAPDLDSGLLYRRYQQTVGEHVFGAWGTDREWAAQTHTAMREEGLADVQTTIDAEYWVGGGTGCLFVATVIQELAGPLQSAGMTEAELNRLGKLLKHHDLVVAGHPLYYTSGRRAPDVTF